MLTVPNVPDIENLYVIEHIPGSAGKSKAPLSQGSFIAAFQPYSFPGGFTQKRKNASQFLAKTQSY